MEKDEDSLIYCDVLGCTEKTHQSYPHGIFSGWKWLNGVGKYVCPGCRRKTEDIYGNNWEDKLEFKNVRKS